MFNEILVTLITLSFTVTSQAAIALIAPLLSTVATDSLSELQVTDLSNVVSDNTVAVNCSVSSTTKILVDLFNKKHL